MQVDTALPTINVMEVNSVDFTDVREVQQALGCLALQSQRLVASTERASRTNAPAIVIATVQRVKGVTINVAIITPHLETLKMVPSRLAHFEPSASS